MSAIKNRTGETRIMNCGLKATIIAYRRSDDIDVQFEDGAIVRGKTYDCFKKGSIAHPDYISGSKAQSRLSETRMMSCGLKATIIVYRRSKDINVQFEDGAIVRGKTYDCFKKGSIAHPDYISGSKAQSRLSETRMMNCGLKAKIIAYRKAIDIDVQFEDGTIVTNRAYVNFTKGQINHPEGKAKLRLGETRMMSCGLKATIVAYRKANDIDVQFEEGSVVQNKTYDSFKKGIIKYTKTIS